MNYQNSVVAPQKLKMGSPYDLAILLLGIYPKRLESRDLDRFLCNHVYSSIIYNSRKVEATQASIDG